MINEQRIIVINMTKFIIYVKYNIHETITPIMGIIAKSGIIIIVINIHSQFDLGWLDI